MAEGWEMKTVRARSGDDIEAQHALVGGWEPYAVSLHDNGSFSFHYRRPLAAPSTQGFDKVPQTKQRWYRR